MKLQSKGSVSQTWTAHSTSPVALYGDIVGAGLTIATMRSQQKSPQRRNPQGPVTLTLIVWTTRAAQTTATVAMDLNTVTTPLFQEAQQHQGTLQQQRFHKTIAMMTQTAHLTSAAPNGAIVVTGQTTVVIDLLEHARVIQIVQTMPVARSGDSAVTGQTTANQMMHQ